jgi:hypothetical protein
MLFEGLPADQAVDALLNRGIKAEFLEQAGGKTIEAFRVRGDTGEATDTAKVGRMRNFITIAATVSSISQSRQPGSIKHHTTKQTDTENSLTSGAVPGSVSTPQYRTAVCVQPG